MLHSRNLSHSMIERLAAMEPEPAGEVEPAAPPAPTRPSPARSVRQMIQSAGYRKRQILERMLMD